MEGLFDWLKNDKKQLEVKQSRQNSGVPVLYPSKNKYNALWAHSRARRVRFWLDFRMYLFLAPNGSGIPVSGLCPSQKCKQSNRQLEPPLPLKFSCRIFRNSALFIPPNFSFNP